MIKARVSIKELKQEPFILNASENVRTYLSNLGFTADYYTSGQYGWNEDIYHIGRYTYISIGYRPHGKRWLTDREELYLSIQPNRDAFIMAVNKICCNGPEPFDKVQIEYLEEMESKK